MSWDYDMQNITSDLITKLKSSQSRNSRVLIAGDLNFDIIDLLPRLPEVGEEIFITSRSRTLAGSAGIFTHAIGKLGGKADFIGKVGDDEGGRNLCEQLRRIGVNVERKQLNSIDAAEVRRSEPAANISQSTCRPIHASRFCSSAWATFAAARLPRDSFCTR